MSVVRSPELLAALTEWVEDFEALLAEGARSARIQWDIEGHAEPLTLLATQKRGVEIIEPGSGPVPAREWLAR